MPGLTDIQELHGHRFRLRRATGLKAARAQWAWAQIAGPKGAHVVALGAAAVAEMTKRLLTEDKRSALELLGPVDERRGLAMIAIVQCMNNETMTPDDQQSLAEHFVIGWVDIAAGEHEDGSTKWAPINSFDDLDSRLDGRNDAQIWTDLIWHQVPFCLGPTTAAAGT
jgi:hypothetical protein